MTSPCRFRRHSEYIKQAKVRFLLLSCAKLLWKLDSFVSMMRKEKIHSSRAWAGSTLFYTKRSRVSLIWAIMETDKGDEKRAGEVPT